MQTADNLDKIIANRRYKNQLLHKKRQIKLYTLSVDFLQDYLIVRVDNMLWLQSRLGNRYWNTKRGTARAHLKIGIRILNVGQPGHI
jgi:hypothetical protein